MTKEAIAVRMDAVSPESIRWLWPGRIPLGKLTMLVGDPGLGKSVLVLTIASHVSPCLVARFGVISFSQPAGCTLRGPTQPVVLLSAHDDLVAEGILGLRH